MADWHFGSIVISYLFFICPTTRIDEVKYFSLWWSSMKQRIYYNFPAILKSLLHIWTEASWQVRDKDTVNLSH